MLFLAMGSVKCVIDLLYVRLICYETNHTIQAKIQSPRSMHIDQLNLHQRYE